MTTVVCRIVEVCAFRINRDKPEFLLLKRSGEETLYPGMWQIITGSIHEGETALAAALREFKEETNLTPRHFWVVPYTGSFYDPANDVVNMAPFFAAQVLPDAHPLLSHEHTLFEWLPFEASRRRLVWPGQRDGLDVVMKCIIGGEDAARFTEISLQRTSRPTV